jgi:hypothetical protein
VRIIRFRTTKLIVRLYRAGTIRSWTTRKILKLSAPSVVAEENVEFSVGTKPQHTAVVIAAGRLCFIALTGRDRRAVVLKSAQHDQVVIESERRTIPNEAIDTIAK